MSKLDTSRRVLEDASEWEPNYVCQMGQTWNQSSKSAAC